MPSSLSSIVSSFDLKSETSSSFFPLNTWRSRKVLNRPNVTTVASRGKGRPEERERDGGAASWWSCQNTRLSVQSAVVCGCSWVVGSVRGRMRVLTVCRFNPLTYAGAHGLLVQSVDRCGRSSWLLR
ncbi:unnamed protein product [Rangifer tarandus platyrhynchus]|uniref:Uncharacterized protein n=1 Tax=Rangifer tarandus platyrhynchus TaxID=3082113 RepID=A0AC59ZVP0_RANTA